MYVHTGRIFDLDEKPPEDIEDNGWRATFEFHADLAYAFNHDETDDDEVFEYSIIDPRGDLAATGYGRSAEEVLDAAREALAEQPEHWLILGGRLLTITADELAAGLDVGGPVARIEDHGRGERLVVFRSKTDAGQYVRALWQARLTFDLDSVVQVLGTYSLVRWACGQRAKGVLSLERHIDNLAASPANELACDRREYLLTEDDISPSFRGALAGLQGVRIRAGAVVYREA